MDEEELSRKCIGIETYGSDSGRWGENARRDVQEVWSRNVRVKMRESGLGKTTTLRLEDGIE